MISLEESGGALLGFCGRVFLLQGRVFSLIEFRVRFLKLALLFLLDLALGGVFWCSG